MRGTRKTRRFAIALAGALLTGGALLASAAAGAAPSISAFPSAGLVDSDVVKVTIGASGGPATYYVAQCADVAAVPDDEQCGPWIEARDGGTGTEVEIVVRAGQVGAQPSARCPTEEGRCVLRVSRAEAEATKISSLAAATPPPPTTLVQEIGLEILREDGSTTSTTSPTSTTRPTQVGGVVVRPTQPQRPGSSGPAEPAVGGVTEGRTELARTGVEGTVALTLVALGLLDLGWLALSAVPGHARSRLEASPA